MTSNPYTEPKITHAEIEIRAADGTLLRGEQIPFIQGESGQRLIQWPPTSPPIPNGGSLTLKWYAE